MLPMSYGKRLSRALDHGGLTQQQLAEKVGISQQAVNKLVLRGRVGSRFTPQIAAACGVSADWLATGKGPMEAREDAVPFTAKITDEAAEVARAYMKLSPALKASIKTMIFSMASAQSVARWLLIEAPKGDGYSAWEKAIQSAYDAEVKQMKLDFGR